MNATSKLVKAWESKNAKNAAKAGGISLMALSLAACGGSSTPVVVADDAAVADPVVPVVDAAKTLTFTKDVIDVLTGGSGDDVAIGDAATVSAADSFVGGAGNDTLKMYGSLTMPTVTAVENVYFSAIVGDVDVSAKSFTNIEFDAATTTAAGADTVTVTTGQTVVLDSIVDGDAADDANNKGEVEIASALAVTSVSVEVQGVGAAAAADDVEIDITGTGVTSASFASTTGKNYVGIDNTGAALKTITVTGSQLFDADENALTAVTTIDASATTGGVLFNTTGGTQDLVFKGGSGDDTLNIGSGLDADDTLTFGEGTDTLILTAAALTAATNAQVKEINATTGLERVMSNTAAGDGVAIDFSKLTSVAAAGVVANAPVANGDDVDGDNAFTVTGISATDTILIGGAVTGGLALATGDANGGDAINITTASNGGSDTVNILFTAASTVTGGASADTDANAGHTSGDALAADTVENINITTASATADVAFVAGTADGTDTAGQSVTVGANGTITISGAGDVNLGTVVSAAGASADDLTIDGSAMTGILTVTTGVGNDTIKGGSKADVLDAGTGVNTITTGAGSDTITVADGASTTTAMTTVTDFSAGAAGDKFNFAAGTAVTFEALTAANATAIAADTTLAAAADQAHTQLAANEATAFTFGDKTYLVFEDGTGAGGYDAAEDAIILLTGVALADLHTDNVI